MEGNLNRNDFCDYVRDNAARIFVFHEGKLRRLSELPTLDAIAEVVSFFRSGYVPSGCRIIMTTTAPSNR